MKKKAIKLATSTAIAATAFVAAAPANQADAAVNVDQLVQDAQNAGTVLKWAISVEGSADGVTRPWAQYNNAKEAIAKAEAAVKGASFSDKLKYEARLTDPKIQVKRAQAYIDAITSSEKIKGLTADLNTAVSSNDLDKVEAAYHKATAEYRKQTVLLDRVYGQSTRDQVRNAVKPALEKLVASVKNEVTVHMHAREAAADVKAGKLVEAGQKIADAQAILDANVLKWESTLQKSIDDVAASVPLSLVSVSATNNTTVVVKLNKPVTAVSTSQFVFDNGLAVTAATLGADGKTVTLTTTTQAAGKTYTLTYNNTKASFTTAPANNSSLITVDGSEIHSENGKNVAVKAVFKQATGENSQSQVDVIVPAGLVVASIQGVAPTVSATTAPAGYNVYRATPNTSGEVSVILNSGAVATDAYESGKVKFVKLFNGSEVESKSTGTIHFYSVPTSDTFVDGTVSHVDVAGKYFVVGGEKYLVKDGDLLYNENSSALTVESFLAALSKGDKVTATYAKGSASDLRITFNNVLVGWDLDEKFTVNNNELGTVAAPAAGYFRQDDGRITLSGTGDNNYTVHIFNGTGATATKLGQVNVVNGRWSFPTNVDHEAVTQFSFVYQPVNVAYTTLTPSDAQVLNVLEGDFTHGSTFAAYGGAADSSLLGDTLTLTASDVAGLGLVTDEFNVASNASITLVDGDGTEVRYTKGNGNEFAVSTVGTANDTLKITFGSNAAVVKAGTQAGLQGALSIKEVTGITNDYGLKLKAETNTPVVAGGAY
ncbi:hypothetical protein V4V35_05740 [Bacillus infantis]|uniref:hypothetical protein n=1 Tax=Bacillus infantis TaxID=324767 RepID=UPI002FBF051A